jgi:TRAP-type mannitol/chloroaromatic compound transport system substrate-binding protein
MLERGAIDATEWGTLWENITPGFYKVAKYLSYPGVPSRRPRSSS